MRICAYCESVVPDDTFTCPHCSSTSFREMCPRCGSTYEGTVCPACKAADDSAFAERVEQQAQAAAEEKANQGLVWKTVLTVFLPCVGGFFLIKENVRQGFCVWQGFCRHIGMSESTLWHRLVLTVLPVAGW